MSTKRLTTLSMMIAINVVLCILSPIRIANFKFTFEAFPILLTALTFGPIDGLIVGALGSFIYQLFFSGYGITVTTPLWILPHAMSGLIVGLYAKYHNYELSRNQTIFICIVSALLVTSLNILALYVDSKVFGYYSYALVFSNIFVKIIVGVILAIIYSLLIPRIVIYFKR